MTDLEITQLCAEAMGFAFTWNSSHQIFAWDSTNQMAAMATKGSKDVDWCPYDPLHDNAQAMALVKRFKLGVIQPNDDYPGWTVNKLGPDGDDHCWATNTDLNRAICEVCAKMQQVKI